VEPEPETDDEENEPFWLGYRGWASAHPFYNLIPLNTSSYV
jgi:hypothetical protein